MKKELTEEEMLKEIKRHKKTREIWGSLKDVFPDMASKKE